MKQTFVSGDSSAYGEDHNRDNQGPEVKLLAIPKWVLGISGLSAPMHAQEHQAAVARVHHRMDPFGNHRRAAGESGGGELDCGDA